MRLMAVSGLAVGVLAIGCSSGASGPPAPSGTTSQQQTCDPCDPGGAVTQPSGHDKNPDGVAYPTPAAGYGRGLNTVLPNVKLLGYPLADNSKGLQTVALADYYDPCVKRVKLLQIMYSSVWCGPCNQETDAIVAAKSQLDAAQVVIIQALIDGPTPGTGVTKMDLDNWLVTHKSNFTELMDPATRALGFEIDQAAIPWKAKVDPRTMKVIDLSVGFGGDVMGDVQAGLDVTSKPLADADYAKLGETKPQCP